MRGRQHALQWVMNKSVLPLTKVLQKTLVTGAVSFSLSPDANRAATIFIALFFKNSPCTPIAIETKSQ